MRDVFFAALAAAGMVITAHAPAQAVGVRHPFCLQGDEYPALSNCTFDSYAQCQATASGRLLTCIANPYFAGVSNDPRATPYPYSHRQRIKPRPPFVFEED